MNPKIARDPYLRPVAERWGEDAAFEAGWFDDGDTLDAALDDVGWLCTPIAQVQTAVDDLDRDGRAGATAPVVLLSTGGFFPVHDGHLAMMDAAPPAVQADARPVVGGYLSPGHDDYIALKCGSVAVAVSDRLARAEAAVAARGWLAIDPWEALARRVAVPETDVAARLEAYLRHHVHPGIDVVYVCGGDNARFSLAFTERGGCVVVGRPGSEAEVERWRHDPRVAGNPRVLWTAGDDPSSSSARRAADPGPGPGPVPPDPAAPGSSRPAPAHRPPTAGRRLTLRLEDGQAVATLGLPAASWRRFQDGLRAELATRVELRTVSLEEQRRTAAVAGTISLDPLLPGEVVVAVSRCFDLGGHRLLGHVARPGAPPLAEQLASIPGGAWALRDDDRSTGSTLAFLTAQLPEDVVLTSTSFAVDPTAATTAAEIADSRDFLLGADEGGLVVALPGPAVGRAPYLLPYVDPAVRAGLPGADAVAFSLAVWELNAVVFAPTALTVADLPAPTARTLAATGHGPDTALADVCRHHAAVLRRILGDPPSLP